MTSMACPGCDVGSPSVMEPKSGSCSVAIVRMSVDLPAPLGPRRPYIPRGMSRLTLRNARTPLVYVLETPRMARCIGAGDGDRWDERLGNYGPRRTGPHRRRCQRVRSRAASDR